MSMKRNTLCGFGVLSVLSVAWGSTTLLAHRAQHETGDFEALAMHVEVDLPGHTWGAVHPLGLVHSLSELPAEIVLEAKSSTGFGRIKLLNAAGTQLLRLDCSNLSTMGVSELALESEGVSLADALREFPPGHYSVEATTLEGAVLFGSVELSGDLPGLFSVVSPLPGECVAPESAQLSWTAARGAARYVLEIENEALGFGFELQLPAWQTSYALPPNMLQPGETYEYSLVVQGDTDNELEIEGTLLTRGTRSAPRPSSR